MKIKEVEDVLQTCENFDWEVQGFGMLRTYFGDETRLQIWDDRIAVWGNNSTHDHPWSFESTIMAGILYNQRYLESSKGEEYTGILMKPGIGGGVTEGKVKRLLRAQPVEVYAAADSYGQHADELHKTRYQRGTVTLITRDRIREQDTALGLWRGKEAWTFVEPRKATDEEVDKVIRYAIETWF